MKNKIICFLCDGEIEGIDTTLFSVRELWNWSQDMVNLAYHKDRKQWGTVSPPPSEVKKVSITPLKPSDYHVVSHLFYLYTNRNVKIIIQVLD